MKKNTRIFVSVLLVLILLVLIMVMVYNAHYFLLNLKAEKQLTELKSLNKDGFSIRDLNKNGKLDIYEDPGQNIEKRVDDLLQQMTLEEKVGMLWHPPIGVGLEGEILRKPNLRAFSMHSTYDLVVNKKINHFNLFLIPKSDKLAAWHNKLQKIAEQTRLGIPVTLSTDPRHGIQNFIGPELLGSDFSKWPEPIGLAAIGDSLLVNEFAQIANAEYRAVGIRTALHPMADIATEPRWARINGTFGEDAHLAAKLTAAYIYGFQGNELGSGSVACMTKHWPGGGPQEKGEDAHFSYGKNQVYPGNHFDYHLIPFKAAFEAGTAMIMPYYGIPKGITNEDVGMSFNDRIIKGLLREEFGYDGIVCTDWGIIEGVKIFGRVLVEAKSWGVEELSVKERIEKAINAGVDQFGGNTNTRELIELVKEGKISEARIDESVKRILRAKFRMGLFDHPYVDEEKASRIVGNPEFREKGKQAQRKSIVLLKNSLDRNNQKILPLTEGIKIYVENIGRETVAAYANVVDKIDDADVAVIRIAAPWEPRRGDFIESFFHQGDLDFKEPELSRILSILKAKPTVVCIYLDRPAVIPEIAGHAAALLCDFGAFDDAVLDVVFGRYKPSAKLPFELPSSMQAVADQKEDVPYDSQNPLFSFGFGLTYEE